MFGYVNINRNELSYENKKISEIAQILGENENTVKSRMYRAFKKMKLELEQEGALPPFEIGG